MKKIRIFKTKKFQRWARKEKVTDTQLKDVIGEIEEGLIDADLGCGLIKKRVAKSGQGKRGGYRTILAFRHQDRAIFLFGFAKNERANLDETEKDVYKNLATDLLSAPTQQLVKMVKTGLLIEVKYGKK